MGKIMMYAAWVIAVAGAIVQRFVYEAPRGVYLLFLLGCILLCIAGYFVDKKETERKKESIEQSEESKDESKEETEEEQE